MNVELKLRELLLPVLGLRSIEQIQPEQSLVLDLGADSIDFAETLYVIEMNFGVVLETSQIFSGSLQTNADELFDDGRLTEIGATLINQKLTPIRDFLQGMTKIELFSVLTVRDLAKIISIKMIGEQP